MGQFSVLLALMVFGATGCAPRQTEGRPSAPSPYTVSPSAREVLAGRTIGMTVPEEMRAVALQYLRVVGATVIEGGRPALLLDVRWRRQPDLELFDDEAYIVEVEVRSVEADGSRRLKLQGLGEAKDAGSSRRVTLARAAARDLFALH